MTRFPSSLLACALGLGGCYASHSRSVEPPIRMDAAVARDAGPLGARDAGDASTLDRDASDGSLVPWPEVPDAGFEPGTLEFDFHAFCATLFQLRCQFDERCCWVPGRRLDPEGCRVSSEVACAEMAASIAGLEGRYTWDADAANALLRRLREAGSTCGRWGDDDLAFRDVLVGRIPRGGDCTPPALYPYQIWVDYTCQSGLRCALGGTSTSFSGVCADPGGAGEPCWGRTGCDTEHYCAMHRDPALASPGLCAPTRALGEACTGDLQCASGYCPDGRDHCEAARVGAQWCVVYRAA